MNLTMRGRQPMLAPTLTQIETQHGSPTGTAAAVLSLTTAASRAILTGAAGTQTTACAAPYKPMPASPAYVVQPRGIAPAARGYATRSSLRASGVPVEGDAAPLVAPGLAATPGGVVAPAVAMAATSGASTKSAVPSSRELSFLDDKKLSIEEKLYRFMALMVQKSDQQLVDEMKAIAGKTSTSSTKSSSTAAAASGSGTGTTITGGSTSNPAVIHAAQPAPSRDSSDGSAGVPPNSLLAHFRRGASWGDVLGAVGDVAIDASAFAVKELAGPTLAAVATATGFPELAPEALALGNALGQKAADGIESLHSDDGGGGDASDSTTVDSSSTAATANPSLIATASKSTTSGTSSSSSSAASSDTDEKLEMINLQRLVEKQSTMFSALSNVIKSAHDAQMTAVQNIR